ncbi:serine-arginine protein 55 isoform X2 [Parasteatoda tepidariorum]|uniref:serine-arginine protein 55 isoform X2 n=1 Tax=Parasteatoda tepidariorum TaxID=114398 RepID=UPI00077FC701|nr:serine-arginine protein 55 isoform X2 [Parasteatoda tepidariorum]
MSTRIYIGRLSYEVRERDLERFFKGYGKIREILIKNGFGFVEFDDYRDADDAVYELNGKELLGERVTIEHARGSPRGNDMYRDRNRGYRNNQMQRRRQGGGGGGGGRDKYGPPTRTEYRLIVENLSSRVSWQDLKDYMRQAGEVTYADAHKQRRNEGVVEFASYSDMKNAVDKLDDTDLSGRRIKLVEDKSRRRRSRSRSRSKSHSRSQSRSRSRSRSKSRSMSKSRSRSKSRSKSHSRSKSPTKARSSRSLSRKQSRSRSRSPSEDRNDRKSRSRSKSRKSPSRSRSKSSEKRSPSPVQKDDDISNSADDKN